MEAVETQANSDKEFLNDSYKYSLEGAKIIKIEEYPKDGNFYGLILDKTIFHPQGGGQPSDEGEIESKDKGVVLKLEGATLDRERDIVLHKVSKDKFDSTGFSVGDLVDIKINEEKRELYARLHSAGHLLDISVSQLGLDLNPGKGYHFPEGPYVEYSGKIDKTQIDSLIKQIEKISNEIIENSENEDTSISKIYSYEEGVKESLKIPPYLPENKPFRWVKLLKNDTGCPCGGTHVKHVKDIKGLKINKISNKGKVVRISYNVI